MSRSSTMPISAELLAKYGTRGPRYTSCPTAPHCDPGVDREALVSAWRESAHDLSLHLHVGRRMLAGLRPRRHRSAG